MAARQTLQATVTVNAAFLQEIKEVNHSLWELLEQLRCNVQQLPKSAAQCHQFEDELEQLRDEVALHFALEEAYGYFEDPVYVAPHLSERAVELRNEHQALYLRLCELVERVHDMNHRGRLARMWESVADEFEAFHTDLTDHETRELDLILEAYDQDIGVGD